MDRQHLNGVKEVKNRILGNLLRQNILKHCFLRSDKIILIVNPGEEENIIKL